MVALRQYHPKNNSGCQHITPNEYTLMQMYTIEDVGIYSTHQKRESK